MVMFALIYKVENETPTAHISNWGEIYHQSQNGLAPLRVAAISVDNSVNLRHSSQLKSYTANWRKLYGFVSNKQTQICPPLFRSQQKPSR